MPNKFNIIRYYLMCVYFLIWTSVKEIFLTKRVYVLSSNVSMSSVIFVFQNSVMYQLNKCCSFLNINQYIHAWKSFWGCWSMTPEQNYRNYDVLLLVGLEISVNPLISILRDVLYINNIENQKSIEDGTNHNLMSIEAIQNELISIG